MPVYEQRLGLTEAIIHGRKEIVDLKIVKGAQIRLQFAHLHKRGLESTIQQSCRRSLDAAEPQRHATIVAHKMNTKGAQQWPGQACVWLAA